MSDLHHPLVRSVVQQMKPHLHSVESSVVFGTVGAAEADLAIGHRRLVCRLKVNANLLLGDRSRGLRVVNDRRNCVAAVR